MVRPLYALDWKPASASPPTWLMNMGFAGLGVDLGDVHDEAEARSALRAVDKTGMSLAAVRLCADIRAVELPAVLAPALAAVRGRQAVVQLCLGSRLEHDGPSSPRGDAPAADLIKRVSDAAVAAQARLVLDPRCGLWMATMADAVRLGMRVNRGNVGVALNLFEWLAGGPLPLADMVQLALHKLWLVSVSGVERFPDGGIQPAPLVHGEGEAKPLLGELARQGYTGPIGLRLRPEDGPDSVAASLETWRQWTSRRP